MTPKFINTQSTYLKKQIIKWLNKAASQPIYGSSIFGGGDIQDLERLFCTIFQSNYAVALSSGTAAIHTAIIASGLKKEGRILILNCKWEGVDGVVKFFGIEPIRIYEKSMNLEKQILHKNCKNIRAIIIARSDDDESFMSKLKIVCNEKRIILIEDFADLEKIKIKKTIAPAYGDFAIFSFGYNKWIQAGEGGILLCNNFESYRRAVQFTQHPIYQRARLSAKLNNPVNYGLNYRIHPLAASIALYQLQEKTNRSNSLKVK